VGRRILITFEDARARALEAARRQTSRSVAIRDQCTIERGFGWVFFYDAEDFVLHANESARLVGNAPIIINRETGNISATDTSLPIESYIEAYEALGPDRYDAGEWRDYVRKNVIPLDESEP
jgi:hypothetical protein